jgi:hypothetical protein
VFIVLPFPLTEALGKFMSRRGRRRFALDQTMVRQAVATAVRNRPLTHGTNARITAIAPPETAAPAPV